jgi:hypothetical protein
VSVPVIYVLDAQEFAPIIEVARRGEGVSERRVGCYVEFSTDGELTIDRRTTGVRHALWYSFVGGVLEGKVVQHDKDQFRVVPDAGVGGF